MRTADSMSVSMPISKKRCWILTLKDIKRSEGKSRVNPDVCTPGTDGVCHEDTASPCYFRSRLDASARVFGK